MHSAIAKFLIMLAVLVMPFGMAPAAAAHPSQDAMAMHAGMAMQHCPEPSSDQHQPKGAMAACTMACASALPAMDLVRSEPLDPRAAPAIASVDSGIDGLHPETATPPPRSA
jgi:hypothetical protein